MVITDPNPPIKRSTIYIQQTEMDMFDAICEREGTNRSAKLEAYIIKYNMDHHPGNPQQRLDIITTLGTPYKAEKCQQCDNKPTMYGLQGKIWLGFCQLHWDSRKFRVSQSAKDRERRKKP